MIQKSPTFSESRRAPLLPVPPVKILTFAADPEGLLVIQYFPFPIGLAIILVPQLLRIKVSGILKWPQSTTTRSICGRLCNKRILPIPVPPLKLFLSLLLHFLLLLRLLLQSIKGNIP